jgi:hypothetical protein
MDLDHNDDGAPECAADTAIPDFSMDDATSGGFNLWYLSLPQVRVFPEIWKVNAVVELSIKHGSDCQMLCSRTMSSDFLIERWFIV